MADGKAGRGHRGQLDLTNGIALVGDELMERPFRSLRIENGLVADFDGPEGVDQPVHTVDLQRAFVLPGLIDCHVHFDLAAHPAAYGHWRQTPLVRSVTCLHNGLLALRSGITAARDLGCADHLVLDYSARVERELVTGPRVVAAGRPLTITGGHFCEYARVADGPTDIRKAAREQIGAGAGVIKLMATGGISTPGDPGASQLTVEEMAVAVEEAHKRGLLVAAHAHTADGIMAALSAGVDTIEHAAFADDTSLMALRQSNATLVPTVSALNHIVPGIGIPEETVRKSLSARASYRDSTRRAIAAGVRIAAGTDAGTALNPIGGLVDELSMYCQAGMTRKDALRSATSNAGKVVGGGLGVVDIGHPADLMIVSDDPREDLAALRAPLHVVSRGRLLDLSWIEQTLQELGRVIAE